MAKQTSNRESGTAPGPLPLRLAYTGEGIPPADVPLRDLDEGDLHRAHRVRALKASGGEYVEPATPDDLEAVASWLSASGAFTREAGPAPEPPPTDQPADPAGKE